jgi:hypothetical protein
VYVRFWWVCHQACQNLALFGSLLMVVARRSDIAWGDESWGVREDRRFRKLWVRCADKIDLMKLQGMYRWLYVLGICILLGIILSSHMYKLL